MQIYCGRYPGRRAMVASAGQRSAPGLPFVKIGRCTLSRFSETSLSSSTQRRLRLVRLAVELVTVPAYENADKSPKCQDASRYFSANTSRGVLPGRLPSHAQRHLRGKPSRTSHSPRSGSNRRTSTDGGNPDFEPSPGRQRSRHHFPRDDTRAPSRGAAWCRHSAGPSARQLRSRTRTTQPHRHHDWGSWALPGEDARTISPRGPVVEKGRAPRAPGEGPALRNSHPKATSRQPSSLAIEKPCTRAALQATSFASRQESGRLIAAGAGSPSTNALF